MQRFLLRRRVSPLCRVCVLMLAWVLLGAACGAPNRDGPANSEEPAVAPSDTAAETPLPAPTRPAPPPMTSPSPTGFGELVAVGCNGHPSADQVIALLRRASMIPASTRPKVTTGPLCAGTWQYTVLTLPDRDPLQVVTRGAPEALTVETAGTNPCTAQVRANAPAGIVSAISC
jgi:hypothetical protein